METQIKCPQCSSEWTAIKNDDDKTYSRLSLLLIAPEMAAHIRDVHGEEEMALNLERWAISPSPGATGTIIKYS